jgi:hypothetical protein
MRIAAFLLLSINLLAACNRKEKPNYSGPQSQPGKLVSHEKLVELLPKLAGWERVKPQGAITKNEKIERSQATANYEKKVGEQTWTVKLELIDANNDPSVFSPLAIMAHSGSDDVAGHKRGVEFQGFHGIEAWQIKDESVVLALVVDGRFFVRLNGSHVPEATIVEWINAVDLKKLAELGKAASKAGATP